MEETYNLSLILKSIDRKLNVLIALLIQFSKDDSFSDGMKASILKNMGIENSEIATIMNKTSSQISDLLYNIKRQKTKKR